MKISCHYCGKEGHLKAVYNAQKKTSGAAVNIQIHKDKAKSVEEIDKQIERLQQQRQAMTSIPEETPDESNKRARIKTRTAVDTLNTDELTS